MALVPFAHADLDLARLDVDEVVGVGLTAEPRRDHRGRLADEDGRGGRLARAGRDALANGVLLVAAHKAQMEMARQHEPDAEGGEGLEREARTMRRVRGFQRRALGLHQRVMGDDDAERLGIGAREGFGERR